MTLDAAEDRGIRQPAIPATATAMAMETDGKHWVAGLMASHQVVVEMKFCCGVTWQWENIT